MHLLCGSGSDASSFPCPYCLAKSSTITIVNSSGNSKKVRSMPDPDSEHQARSYDQAMKHFNTFRMLGSTPKASRSEDVFSQTKEPSVLLDGPDFLSVLIPDSLHYILGTVRVSIS